MSDLSIDILERSAENLADCAPPGALAAYEGMVAVSARRDDRITCIGVLDPHGCPTERSDPVIRFPLIAPDADPMTDVRGVLEELVRLAAERAAPRVVARWDPMDGTGLKMLEQAGFSPTGTQPYFEIGPDHVEFVSGYRDATGSRVDFARRLG